MTRYTTLTNCVIVD